MRKLLLAATALIALCAPASAADVAAAAATTPLPTLPVKAPALSGYPVGCGMYFGVNTIGSASTVQGAPTGVSVIGGAAGLDLGYTCPIGSTPGSFWFAEAMFDVQNLNGAANGFSLTGPVHLEQRVGVGGALIPFVTQLIPAFGSISTPSLPLLPAGVTQGPSYPYVALALNEDDISSQFMLSTARAWAITPEFDLGMKSRLSNSVMADVWGGIKLNSNELCVGAICPKINSGFVAGVKFDY